MIDIIRSDSRGGADHGWLKSKHTFSFADYYNPEMMGFAKLRVVNEDWIEPGQGFGTHPHRDMEIVTYMIDGALEHKDSMGNGSVIQPGELQRMTAGTGVLHSEFNASDSERAHLLQIWIQTAQRGAPPTYRDKDFGLAPGVTLLASPDGRDGALLEEHVGAEAGEALDPEAEVQLQALLEAVLLRVGEDAVGELLGLHRVQGRQVQRAQLAVHADLRGRVGGDVKVGGALLDHRLQQLVQVRHVFPCS